MNQQFTIFNQRGGRALSLLLCFFLSALFCPSGMAELLASSATSAMTASKTVTKTAGSKSAKGKSSGGKAVSTTPKSTFLNPDFAFPDDVRRDASPAFTKGLKTNDPVMALNAAMQLAVADRLTSRDSIGSVISRYDRVAAAFGQPWRSLALILKARQLNDVYRSSAWKFNQRVLPLDSLSDEPMLWSGAQFRQCIGQTVREVMSAQNSLQSMSLSTISALLTDSEDAEKAGFSVFDFATYQCIGLASTESVNQSIPFRRIDGSGEGGSNESEDVVEAGLSNMALIDALILSDQQRGDSAALALLQARLKKASMMSDDYSESDKDGFVSGYAKHLLDIYPEGSVLRPILISRLYQMGKFRTDNLSNRRALYALLGTTVASTSDESQRKLLEGIRAQLMIPSYTLSTPYQWLTSRKGEVAMNLKNVKNGYLLLVPISPSQAEGESGDKLMISTLRPTGPIKILASWLNTLPQPTEVTDNVAVGPLPAGYYALVLSETQELSGVSSAIRKSRPDIILVSDLNAFSSDASSRSDDKKEVAKYLYVTDATNNAPVVGAKVNFTSTVYRQTGKTSSAVTDKDGKVLLPFESCRAVITRGSDRLTWNGARGYVPSLEKGQTQASILTDLALYHPGDSIQAVVVLSRCGDNLLSVAPDRKFSLLLRDANYQQVDSVALCSDRLGRAVGALHIPADGLTGQFTLQAISEDKYLGNAWVNVADYKAPSFRVSLDSPEVVANDSAGEGDIIRLSGLVGSYSGVPLANATVDLSIDYQPWWRPWMWSRSNASGSYATSAVTDSKGCFSVELSLPVEDVERYRFGIFSAKATATAESGETQTSEPRRFAIGEGYSLEYAGPADIEVVGKEVKLPARVTDITGQSVERKVSYALARISTSTQQPDFSRSDLKGEATLPGISVPASRLPSGMYMLRVVLDKAAKISGEGETAVWRPDTLIQQIIVTRADDVRPPMETALWVPQSSCYARPGESKVDITVGTSYLDNYIYCQVVGKDGTLRREWLRPEGKNMVVKVDAPKDGEIVRLYFEGCHDLECSRQTVTVYPPSQSRSTLFRVDTFRDRIAPGETETWRFRLMSGWSEKSVKSSNSSESNASDNLPASSFVADGAVIAVLSNQALDAIAPFSWDFNPRSLINYSAVGGLESPWARNIYSGNNLAAGVKLNWSAVRFTYPQFRYDDPMSNGRIYIRGRGATYRSLATATPGVAVSEVRDQVAYKMASPDRVYEESAEVALTGGVVNMAMKKESADDMVLEESGVTADSGSGVADDSSSDAIDMRSMEMPLAFFKPLLSTDSEGYVNIDFTVPNFNTTWNLQLLGYDKNLNSALLRESAVASKPVMISTAMPRFLATGDKATISATVFNNTDSDLDIDAQIDILNLATGESIAFESTGNRRLAANSSSVATISFLVPSDMSQIGVRAVARSEKGSDGEQGAVLILPSSTPVTDATTFYLRPGCEEQTVRLPKMNPAAKLTLNFCNNPEWFVLTSLSGLLQPDSESALVQAVALYSNSIASGLLRSNDRLKEGLRKMLESDSEALTSPLKQNEYLKLAALGSTPWVNNAESETARLQSLSSLLDNKSIDESLQKRISGLEKTRNADGSWSWMKGMPGSEWITRQVVSCLGQLRMSGYLPSDKRLRSMLCGGVKYMDSEESKSYNEIVRKQKGEYPLSSEISYLFDRSNASDSKPSGTIAEMERDMLRRLPEEWRGLSLMDKATAAILLNRTGRDADKALARMILESVRQFATYTPDKGMWFDNAGGAYSRMSPSPLMLTSRCLDAFREVEPENNSISGLEQYLILSRQTQDWNLELGQAGVATVVNSILSNEKSLGSESGSASDTACGNDIDNSLTITLDGRELRLPDDPANLPGNFYVNIDPVNGEESVLTIHRHGRTPAWGGVVSQYVAPIQDVRAHEVPQLKVEKALLPVAVGEGGKTASKDATTFKKGDRVRVTLTLTADRELDYLLLTDRLGAWMQPADQLTEYISQDGLWMLRETRTADVNFYITRLPKGKYVISYEVNAARDGEYSNGIAAAQSQYYPLITAHSAGRIINVR